MNAGVSDEAIKEWIAAQLATVPPGKEGASEMTLRWIKLLASPAEVLSLFQTLTSMRCACVLAEDKEGEVSICHVVTRLAAFHIALKQSQGGGS